jgi:integrase
MMLGGLRVGEAITLRGRSVDLARGRLRLAPIAELTNHSPRRTYCALAYEAGASPAFVMSQLGHTCAALSLEVYAKVVERSRDTGARIDALLRAPATDSGVTLAPPITDPA